MDDQSQINPAEQIAFLERFVVDNDELAELEARVGRFNIFDALGVVRQEIRHSNFLAWLLHPAESHGQGQLFLRAVLMDLLRESPREWRPMSPVELEGAPLRGVQVLRESEHLDLLIVAEEPAVVFAIENKIDSSEHSDQLARYKTVVGRRFPKHRPMFVYLTPEGGDSSDEEWVSYDYGRLHDALRRCIRGNEDSIGGDVRSFLEHYLNVLRGHLMDDPEIDRLCETIYRNHRQALDLIFERKSDPRKKVVEEFVAALTRTGEKWIIHNSGYSCAFMPAAWSDIVPPVALDSKLGPHGIVRARLRAGPNRVETYLIVGPSNDSAVREHLIEAIRTDGSRHGLTVSSHGTTKWTRIRSKRVVKISELMSDEDELRAKLDKIASEYHSAMERITPLLQSVYS